MSAHPEFPTIRTIDAEGAFRPRSTASYLLLEGKEAAIVEASTAHASEAIARGVREAGLAPERVRYVIVTHVHLDHAGGAWKLLQAFPNAVCLAHPKAARHLADPSRLLASARAVYGDALFERLFGEMRPIEPGRIRAMEDGERLPFGGRTLTFPYARGHANHHFLVHDSREEVVFTGDSFGLAYPAMEEALGRLFAYPTTTPVDFDAPEALLTVDRIEAMRPRAVALTHFGIEKRVTEMARELRGHLRFLEALDGSLPEDDLLRAQEAHLGAEKWPEAAREWMQPDFRLNAQGLRAAFERR